MSIENKTPRMNSAAAEKAREKRDGFHLTQASADKDQHAFELQQRRDAREQGGGEAVDASLYGHDAIANRNAAAVQFARQANERNKRRSILNRLLGRNKVSAKDMLREEADRMNELVDKRMDSADAPASYQEAADEVATSTEFKANRDFSDKKFVSTEVRSIGREGILHRAGRVARENAIVAGLERENITRARFKEQLRAIDPEVEAEMNTGIFSRAFEIIQEEKKNTTGHIAANNLADALYQMMGDKIDSLVVSKDIDGMRRVLTKNNLENVPAHLIYKVLKEVPEMQAVLTERVMERVNRVKPD